ncbi:MAG: phosphate signaling complex protein PhoU [Candidatus Lokiarchaeota archaeon]|nr:phosphate signaling complex protein PhoU [Candidatus Lokiarchaeota archaeon]
MATKELHNEIIELKNLVLEMGKYALNMLDDSVISLVDNNIELAKDTKIKKEKLHQYDTEIEDKALKLIALYAPMAVDMRTIATCLKANTYIYRIGRYGKDITNIVIEDLSNSSINLKLVNLRHIWEHVHSLVQDALESFDKGDIKIIDDFTSRDDEIDKLRWSIFRECVSYMMEDPKNISICAHYQMIARYLERCGDHACKIAEKVYYMVTGKHIEIS